MRIPNGLLKENKYGINRSIRLCAAALMVTIIEIVYITTIKAETTQGILSDGKIEESVQKTGTEAASSESKEQKNVYGIGSISKMYTTAAVMRLVEEGKIDLDESLVTYIPEFTMADERYADITPRMLLNHTSGLMGTTTHDSFTFGKSDIRYHDSLLRELSTQKLKADPGAYGVYCNDGFTLAELLVERVSGMSYSEYLEQSFFKPMGIQNTFTPVDQFEEDHLADTYLGTTKIPYVNCHLIGSGGIYGTASDVAQFGQLFTGKYPDLLTDKSLTEMAESNSEKDTIGHVEGDQLFNYGLGWDCVDTYPYNTYGIRALSKSGSVILQNATLVVLPEEGISASMLLSGGSGDESIYAMQDILLEILKEEGIIDEVKDLKVQVLKNQEAQLLPDEMREYAGCYLGSQMLQVSFLDSGNMQIQNLEDEYTMLSEYVYIGNEQFAPLNGAYFDHNGQLTYNSDGNTGYGTVSFSEESNGKTYLVGSGYESIYDLGKNAGSMIFAERIEEDVQNQQALEKWQERDGHFYFLTESVYNAWNYYTEGIVELQCNREVPGYVHTDKKTDTAHILDEDCAQGEIDIPIMNGRDLATYQFSTLAKNKGEEQLLLSTLTYITEEQVDSIDTLPQELTMKENEATAWYRIGAEHANQSVRITVPDQGAYYLYNDKRDCIASSVILTNGENILLPSDGYLVLAGEQGQTFQIQGEWMK